LKSCKNCQRLRRKLRQAIAIAVRLDECLHDVLKGNEKMKKMKNNT
jgi:hypothetical protein